MARGDGVARVRHAPPAARLPEGREPGDARGATWPWIIGGSAFVIGCAVAAAIYTAGQLELANRDGVAWLKNISGPVAALIGVVVGGLVVKVMNNVGRTMRGQGTLGSNQVALDRKLDAIGTRLDALEKPAAPISPEVSQALVQELSSLRESVNAVAGKVGRANATGGQPAVPEPLYVPPTRTPASPAVPTAPVGEGQPRRRYAASDPATQDPLDRSQVWHSGLTDQAPALLPEMPPQPPASTYTDPVGRRWEERLRRPRGT